MQRTLVTAVLTLGVLASAPSAAQADTVLTFQPPCGGNSTAELGFTLHPYTSQGFVVFSDLLLSTCTGSPAYGGPAAQIGIFTATASIAAVDGSPFSLFAIDLAKLSDVAGRAGPLTFTGHFLGGGGITQTFAVDWTGLVGPPVFSTFSFSEAFTNLVSVDLPPQGSLPLGLPEYQFTNVHLNAVTPTPEPASWLLAATALAGLGGVARVRRRPS